MYKNKNVFVSGGAGVIGLELVLLLHERGAKVIVGDLKERPVDFPQDIIYLKGDLNLLNPNVLISFAPEYFFHLAASFERSNESWEHWDNNFWNNLRLSNYLMGIIKEMSSIKRVINCSSYLIYDKALYQFNIPPANPRRLKETDAIQPRNLTGMAKCAHEIELQYLDGFDHHQFTAVSARIYRGYGFNSRDVISRWIRALLQGDAISVYNSDGAFDYMFGSDTAEGLLRLGLSDYSGVVNLGTGKSRKVSEIVAILRNYFPNAKIHNSSTSELIESSEADTTLLESILGWVPSSKLENTIPKLIEFEKGKLNETSIHLPPSGVLVTSISGKTSLLKDVKNSLPKLKGNWRLIGTDIDGDCIGRHFVDEFFTSERLGRGYLKELLDIIVKFDIRIIIPTREGDINFFNQNREAFEDRDVRIMCTSNAERFTDKLLFAKEFASVKEIIPAYDSLSELNQNHSASRIVVKERYGSGSQGVLIDVSLEEAMVQSRQMLNPIFQPFIHGVEYSVDGYTDAECELLGIVIRERVKVINGESQITEVKKNTFQYYDSLVEIIKSLKIQYHFVLQFILSPEGDIHIIEVNARYGGASSAAFYAGLDSFVWFVNGARKNLTKNIVTPSESFRQIKYVESFIV